MKLIYTKQFIDEFYKEYLDNNISLIQLCKNKNLSWSSIQKALRRNNLKSKPSVYTDKLIDDIYKEHLNKQKSISLLAKEKNLSRELLSKYIKEISLDKKIRFFKSGGQFINEDYFSKIDSDNKAYILGLLFADGCISYSKNRPCISLALHLKDKYLLELIALELGKNINIYCYNNLAEIKINRDRIANDLQYFGMSQNKSIKGNLKLPEIDNKYMNGFIRGFLDGDGTVSKKGHVCFYSTSLKILQEIQNTLTNLGCSKKVNIHSVNHKELNFLPYYHLHFARKNSSNIIYPYLYKNAELFLLRKKERFIL